jgi:bifunctional DNA-binding transcriptional regulator/antitoxin component of YhaV-PrlF toxin-antitoxin module
MSTYTTLLSSKNQFTLPVELLTKLGWKSGQRFTLFIDGNSVILKTSDDILDDITKIVSKYNLPKVSVENALIQTKTKHLNSKYSYDNQ